VGNNYHSVDELDVARALSITVTSSVLGTGLVVGVLGHTTILGHLNKVESTVETTGELRDIDIKRKFLVVGVEHLGS